MQNSFSQGFVATSFFLDYAGRNCNQISLENMSLGFDRQIVADRLPCVTFMKIILYRKRTGYE